MTGRMASNVWKHFTKVKIDGRNKAKCKYCQKLYVGDSSQGTSHLRKHLARCPRRTMNDIRQQFMKSDNSTLKMEKGGASEFKCNEQEYRSELVTMVITHGYPLSMVENTFFRRFLGKLQPNFIEMSRNTIREDCMNLYAMEKRELMNVFENLSSRIAITTDMWTSVNKKYSYMVITGHYIDNDWVLQSRILRLFYVPCPLTSKILCKYLTRSLTDWNIDSKLSTITLDNCSTNDSIVHMLSDKLKLKSLLMGGNMLHMRCCAHILNLIVKAGLDTIGDTIENIRNSVLYWTVSPKKWEKFEETAQQLHIETGKKLTLDCKTRWNSTFFMLRDALEYKDVFSRLKLCDSNYNCLPNEFDWKMANEISEKLSTFIEAIIIFSGPEHHSSNRHLSIIYAMKVAVMKWKCCGILNIENMACEMMTKLEKYWSTINVIFGVAAILDPRWKVQGIEYIFNQEISKVVAIDIECVVSAFKKLFEEYSKNEVGITGESSKDNIVREDQTKFKSVLCPFYEFENDKKKRRISKLEFDIYLEDEIISNEGEFNVLDWWKANSGRYPILAKMAKDIRAIPFSTFAYESAFSISGSFISPIRSGLKPQTIEALICTQNWIKAKVNDSDDISGFEFDDKNVCSEYVDLHNEDHHVLG